MKDTNKRKIKKMIYAALVLSYILIITTVTTHATSTVYDYIQIGYPELRYYNIDNETVSYTDSLEMWVGVEKINNSSIHTTILLTMDENIDINPIFIDLIQTNYRLSNWQERTKIGRYTKSIINTAEQSITTSIRITKQLNGNQLQLDYYITSPSSTLWNAIYYLDNDYNSGENGGNGIYAITHKAIRGIAINENNTKVYATEMTTNAIIEEMMMINNNNLGNISGQLGGTFDPDIIEIPTGEEDIKDLYEQLYDEQSKEEFIQSVENTIIELEESTTIVYVTTLLTEILTLPFVISIVPVGMFFVVVRLLLH